MHGGKDFPAAQLGRMLVNRRGGIGILFRAMAQHHEHGLGEFIAFHAKGLAQDRAVRKLALLKIGFLIETF